MYIQPFSWKWIDEKFDIKWIYLLCFIFVDTAFLLCGAEILAHTVITDNSIRSVVQSVLYTDVLCLTLVSGNDRPRFATRRIRLPSRQLASVISPVEK